MYTPTQAERRTAAQHCPHTGRSHLMYPILMKIQLYKYIYIVGGTPSSTEDSTHISCISLCVVQEMSINAALFFHYSVSVHGLTLFRWQQIKVPHDLRYGESHSQNGENIAVSNSTAYTDMKSVTIILNHLIFCCILF